MKKPDMTDFDDDTIGLITFDSWRDWENVKWPIRMLFLTVFLWFMVEIWGAVCELSYRQ